MSNTTYRVLVEKLGGSDPTDFIGNEGELFYNPDAETPTLKLSNGSTPGGITIGGEGATADNNIWVQQFLSNDPANSSPQAAAAVEYDADENIIALFYNDMSDINEEHTSVAKFDSAGTKLWEVKLDAGTNTNGWGLAVDNTNGHIYVSGRIDNISALLCLNTAGGGIIWGYTYDFGGSSAAPVVDVLSNGDPVIVGYNGGDAQINVTRISSINGNSIWSRGLNGVGDESAVGMAVGPNDEIVAVGYMTQIGTGGDTEDHMLVAKYDSNGTLAWQKAVLFDAGYDCYGADADIDSAGNVYVCGAYQRLLQPPNTTSAMCLFKLNNNGVKQWSRRVVGNCQDFSTSIVVGPDNHLYLSGITGRANNTKFDWVLAKYDMNGLVVWQRLIDNTENWTASLPFSEGYGANNIAVRNGYIAASGVVSGFLGAAAKAAIAQFDTAGTLWNSGPWQFIGASFVGLLDSTASNIIVSNANKVDSDIEGTISITTINPDISTSNYLVGTLYNNTNKYPDVGRYLSTETSNYTDASVIPVTKEIVFLSPLSGGNASYKIIQDGLYDGQQIKFLPQHLNGTVPQDVGNIYVYVDKLYSIENGVTPGAWVLFSSPISSPNKILATLTWNAVNNCWVPDPYAYD